MGHIPVLGIVGWSGSGKTTLIEALLPELRKRGIRAAVIKHDGHDFAVDQWGKDSWRFTQAGAEVTAVFSSTHAVILENRPLRPEELAARVTGVDLILAEGCKREKWPKLLVCTGEAGEAPAVPPSECAAVVSGGPEGYGRPRFRRDDIAGLADFICRGHWQTQHFSGKTAK